MIHEKLKNYAIILASGSGNRFGSNIPKQFTKLCGKTILTCTITAFEKSPFIDEIIIVTNPEYINLTKKIINKSKFNKVSQIITGGATRKDSSYNAVNSIFDKEANVLIHDCARVCITQKIIADCVSGLENHDAIITAIPMTDTVIEVYDDKVIKIPNRNLLKRVQTPQAFKLSLIKKAHELAKYDNGFTDDCGMILKYNLSEIYIVEGDSQNIKVTYPQDIYIAKKILKQQKNDI